MDSYEENWIECETQDNDNSFPFAVQSLYEEMSAKRYLFLIIIQFQKIFNNNNLRILFVKWHNFIIF